MRRAVLLAVVLLLSACSSAEMSRNVYEGVRARDQAREGTLQQAPGDRLPGYDQYEKERKR